MWKKIAFPHPTKFSTTCKVLPSCCEPSVHQKTSKTPKNVWSNLKLQVAYLYAKGGFQPQKDWKF
jgi:hypothetical protein